MAIIRRSPAGRRLAALAVLLGFVQLLVSACTSSTGPSAPHAASGASNPSGCPRSGTYSGGATSPITLTIKSCAIHDLHGTALLYCVGAAGTSSQISPYVDPDTIAVGSGGTFSDDYKYLIGNGTWTLHVEGAVTGNGTATGFSSIHGVGCSAGSLGWAAALPGVTLPARPTAPSSTPATGCSPQPCQTQDAVTVSVQTATVVSDSSNPSSPGVDIGFTVVNNGTSGITISNTFTNFTLEFGDGNQADHSYDQFAYSNGQTVPCMRSDPAVVAPGTEVSRHICFALSGPESGQSMTFVWTLVDPGNFSIPIGVLR